MVLLDTPALPASTELPALPVHLALPEIPVALPVLPVRMARPVHRDRPALPEIWDRPALLVLLVLLEPPVNSMNKWYHVLKSALSPSEVAEVTAYAMTKTAVEAQVGYKGGSQKSAIRGSELRWLPRHEPIIQPLCALISAKCKATNGQHFGVDMIDFDALQFTTYASLHEGHYDWHQDCSLVMKPESQTPFDRKLSFVIQMSHRTDYKGGELFVNPGGNQHAAEGFTDIGDMIIFPALLWHKVQPVTEGVRNSLVGWWTGPNWK